MASSTNTDHAAPNVTLKTVMVMASVRTGGCRHSQRIPSTTSRTTWRVLASGERRRAGDPGRRARPPTPPAPPGRRTGTPSRRRTRRRRSAVPTNWLAVTRPAISRLLAIPRSALLHHHREQRRGGGVGERLGDSEEEHRDQHDDDVDPPGPDRDRQTGQHRRPQQVDDDHDPPAVETVGDGAGVQAEQEERQPLQQQRHRHQLWVAGLGGDEQRTGGDLEAVAEVGHPRRPQQPPEVAAEPGRGRWLRRPSSRGGTVPSEHAAPSRRAAAPEAETGAVAGGST